MSETFPWASLLQMALARGIAPDAAWNMTPAELAMLFAPRSAAPFNRSDLQSLMNQYPDAKPPTK